MSGPGGRFDRLLAEAIADDADDEDEPVPVCVGPRVAAPTKVVGSGNEAQASARLLFPEPPGIPAPPEPPLWPGTAGPGASGARVRVELVRELGLERTAEPKPEHRKPRRRRGSKESKEPERFADPASWMPTATFVDLGGLVRLGPVARPSTVDE